MTSLYNGWTPAIIDETRYDANQALGKVMDATGAEGYLEWYARNINNKMSYSDILRVCEEWLRGDECDCNGGLTCTKCYPITDEIPY